MNYAEIKRRDIANGVGVRVSLFVSGCRNHCPGCFNRDTWRFDSGEPFGEEAQRAILDALSPAFVNGLTVLGGEPMEPENQAGLLPFLRRVRSERPGKTIWLYTGFTLEQIFGDSRAGTGDARALLAQIDVLVDGPFVEAEKNLSLAFRGSENQRLIDMPATLREGRIVLWSNQ